MKNKKAEIQPIWLVITFVIAGAILFFFFNNLFPTLYAETPYFKGQSEYATRDCDGDDVTGLTDPCPCVSTIPNQQTKESNKGCPTPDPEATSNCPDLCKAAKTAAKASSASKNS